MDKMWFTADTHFGSERTLELSMRPFSSVEEMDQTMIDNWNKKVGPNDYVYHLGDFGNYEVAKHLNGHINLLFGNYERNDVISGKFTSSDIAHKFGFFTVHTTDVFALNLTFFTERIGDFWVQMVHEPSHRKVHSNQFCLFGHIHKLCMVRSYGLNVGVDCHHFSPIDVETIEFYQKAIEQYYDAEVFQ